jgi:hypothetical protein
MPDLKSQLIVSLVDQVTGPAKTVADALKKAEGQIKSIDQAFKGTGASNRFQQQLASLGRSSADIDRVANSWREYARSAAGAENSANWTKGQAQQIKSWEAQTISALKSVSAQERQFATTQQATGEAAKRRFLPHGPGGVRAGRVGEYVPGIGGAIVGGSLAHQAWEGAKSGADIQSERVKMKAAGIPDEEIEKSGKQIVDIATRVPGTKISTGLEDYKHLRSVLTHPDEAPALFEDVERSRAAMNASDRTGQMAEGLPFALKGAELLGKTRDPEEFRKYMDSFVKGQQVMGKTITPEQQFEFAKYARAAAPQLSDRFLGSTALSLGQEMGGSGAGTAIATFQRELQAGFPGNHGAAKEFVRLGLANENDFEKTKTGEIKGLKEGKHVEGWQMAMSDPDQWWYKYGKPALEKQGITDPQAQAAEITKMFPNRTASDLISKFNNQEQSFKQHAELYNQAQGLGAVEANQKDPYQAVSAFQAAISNFAGTLSEPGVARAGEVLGQLGKDISGFTAKLSDWQKKNPEEAKAASSAGIYGAVAGIGRGACPSQLLLASCRASMPTKNIAGQKRTRSGRTQKRSSLSKTSNCDVSVWAATAHL